MISRGIAELLHERSIEEFGGAKGIRDEGGVEVALARPYQTSLKAYSDEFIMSPLGIGDVQQHLQDARRRRPGDMVSGQQFPFTHLQQRSIVHEQVVHPSRWGLRG